MVAGGEGANFRLLFPSILVFCCIGTYAVGNSTFEIYSIAAFTVLGFILKKLDCEPATLVLGIILGRLVEENLRRALRISDGSPAVFVTDHTSLVLLGSALILLFVVLNPRVQRVREEALKE